MTKCIDKIKKPEVLYCNSLNTSQTSKFNRQFIKVFNASFLAEHFNLQATYKDIRTFLNNINCLTKAKTEVNKNLIINYQLDKENNMTKIKATMRELHEYATTNPCNMNINNKNLLQRSYVTDLTFTVDSFSKTLLYI